MATSQRTIFVYDGFSKENHELLGRLYIGVVHGRETWSFEYDENWLKTANTRMTLSPELQFVAGRQFSAQGAFGMFEDAAPDRWGRTLITKRERLLAARQQRKPRQLYTPDFLLGVYDETRMGGLRFKEALDGEFLSADEEIAAPPWTSLRSLEEASRQVESDDASISEYWLNQLIRPGSSLGGARPKAAVVDTEGSLWIAKFPSRHDENDTGAWEMVAHELAGLCNLRIPEAKTERFSSLGTTFLVKRFDREGTRRIHMASAMTLLGLKDGAGAADGIGYLDIASIIRSSGASPREDLLELWRRIVFNIAISNTDDHLRNHAFLYTSKGWKLSPLYDVNPVPYGNELSLNINEHSNELDISLALQVAPRFGLSAEYARGEATNILQIVGENWKPLAQKQGIRRSQIEAMEPAFSMCSHSPLTP